MYYNDLTPSEDLFHACMRIDRTVEKENSDIDVELDALLRR